MCPLAGTCVQNVKGNKKRSLGRTENRWKHNINRVLKEMVG
jgi:hypothetical protein